MAANALSTQVYSTLLYSTLPAIFDADKDIKMRREREKVLCSANGNKRSLTRLSRVRAPKAEQPALLQPPALAS